ncbi:hypothetical protein E7Y32_07110 [Arthrobacter sp. UKPF54-2]|uniref:hypothetical protein n=1 Tax=Arthrobacter sp. UKPF54-2 TaxID=2600159 RepID=UPI0011B0FE13|nr:hypothetical protein [Arthrobacter sp. UKPF54-2]QDY90004.1 hypothetical protein E7Y32_07110 [Arthrobacter sp. UKPF54-2]
MSDTPALAVPIGAFLGWAGLFVHNLAELPGQSFLSPESLVPLLVTAVLVAGWFTPERQAATIALLCWGVLNLVGGGVLSVLPLPVLPFVPEQTLSHYLVHGVYALAQVPLVLSTVVWLRLRHRSGRRISP